MASLCRPARCSSAPQLRVAALRSSMALVCSASCDAFWKYTMALSGWFALAKMTPVLRNASGLSR